MVFSDNCIYIGQTDPMGNRILFAGDDSVVSDQYRTAYRIADGQDELTIFHDHLELNGSGDRFFAGLDRIVERIGQESDQIFLGHDQSGQVVDDKCHRDLPVACGLVFLVQDDVHNSMVCIDIAKLCLHGSGHPGDIFRRFFCPAAVEKSLNAVQLVFVIVQEPPLLLVL